MRFVVFGAGAVGGVIGARLAEHDHDVVLIARRNQVAAIRACGLRVESPQGTATINVHVVEKPAEISWTADDVVFLAMKTQDTLSALQELATVAPATLPIICVQNGVENERLALRWFDRVYGICVMCPTGYLTPGVLQAWSAPVTGILDIGAYPSGVDKTAEAIAGALRASSFHSEPRHDIMRWKYAKLLMNLGNAIEAICGPSGRRGALNARAREEGVACLNAAGMDYVSDEEDKARRGSILRVAPIGNQDRPGGSSWQSLQRQTHTIEADYLNGEVALLGRIHHIPTPVNTLLQRLANQFAREGRPPGSMSVEELAALLRDGN